RVLGLGGNREGAAAVLRAHLFALLPLRERRHPPGTFTRRNVGNQVEPHPRPTDQRGDASVAQGLVPLVGPVGDVQEQVLVDELLPGLGVLVRTLVGATDAHGVARDGVLSATRLPDSVGGRNRYTDVTADVG